MSKYRDDFLSWDDEDINLDMLLGEYTDDEVKPPGNATKSDTSVVYVCPQCGKTYKSVSGFRGHCLKKHGVSLKAHQHRETAAEQPKPADTEECNNPSVIFDQIFPDAYTQTLKNIQTDPIYNVFGKSEEAEISEFCEDNATIQSYFKTVMESSRGIAISTIHERETFFKELHRTRTNKNIIQKGCRLFKEEGCSKPDTAVNNFIQVVIMDVTGEIIKSIVKLEKEQSTVNQSCISENDQKVLFYISGYIIHAMNKKYSKSADKKEMYEKIEKLQSKSSEISFVSKYDTWYRKKDRGGLKKPCDELFLLVREFEVVVRKSVDTKNLNSNSLKKTQLKEKVLDSFIVKHYEERLFPDNHEDNGETRDENSFVEDALNLFLTIRGFAVAKLEKRKVNLSAKNEKKTKTSASLRGALKCISSDIINKQMINH